MRFTSSASRNSCARELRKARRPREGGVVHQNVDAAEALERAADDLLRRAVGGDVARHGQRAVAERRGQCLRAGGVADVDGDARAALVQPLGGRAAEPARGARDDRDAAAEIARAVNEGVRLETREYADPPERPQPSAPARRRRGVASDQGPMPSTRGRTYAANTLCLRSSRAVMLGTLSPPRSWSRAPETPRDASPAHAAHRSLFVAIGAAVVLFAAAYGNSWRNSFHFDDSHVVETNPALRSLTSIPRFFTDARTFSSLPANQTYRPIVTLTLAIDHAIAEVATGNGLDPRAYHFTQLLLLALVAALVGGIARAALCQSVARR